MDFLDANGVPDLHKLITLFGRYDLITAEAWAEWDRAVAEYQARLREPPSK